MSFIFPTSLETCLAPLRVHTTIKASSVRNCRPIVTKTRNFLPIFNKSLSHQIKKHQSGCLGTNTSLDEHAYLHARRSVLLWQRTKYTAPLITLRRLNKYPAKAHSIASTFAGRSSTTLTHANTHVSSRIRTHYISVRAVQAWYILYTARSLWSAEIWQSDMALHERTAFLFCIFEKSWHSVGSIPSPFINHSMRFDCRRQDSFLSDSNELVSHCRLFGTVAIGQKMLHKITQEEKTVHIWSFQFGDRQLFWQVGPSLCNLCGHAFLGAVTKLWKVTIRFVFFFRLSVRLSAQNSAPTGRIVIKFATWVFFGYLARKFEFH